MPNNKVFQHHNALRAPIKGHDTYTTKRLSFIYSCCCLQTSLATV